MSTGNENRSGRNSLGELLREKLGFAFTAASDSPELQEHIANDRLEPVAERTVSVNIGRRRAVAAGVEDELINVKSLSPAEYQQRMREVMSIVVEVEFAKALQLDEHVRKAIVKFLAVEKPFTIRQIRAAADVLKSTETYRSIASEQWMKAFAEPTFTSAQVAAMKREAYIQGQNDERQRSAGRGNEVPDPPESFDWMRRALNAEDDARSARQALSQLRDLYEFELGQLRKQLEELRTPTSRMDGL